MTEERIIKCQSCGTQIPDDKVRTPCPNCGDTKRNYVVSLSDKLGLKVEVSENRQRIIFDKIYILYSILILGALIGLGGTLFKGISIEKNTAFIVLVSVVFISVIAIIIWANIIIKQIEKTSGKRIITFKWKSLILLDVWIGIIRQPFILLLFSLVVTYQVLNIVGQVKSPLSMDLTMLSATFGILVLAAAAFQKADSKLRKKLMPIAKYFILAAFLLIVFNVTYSILSSMKFDPSQFRLNYEWIISELMYILLVLGGMFGGAYSFSTALIDLIILLKEDL